MKQPEYSPLEALERIKLMMKYDMSKTLNENKQVIKEQLYDPTVLATGTAGAVTGAGIAGGLWAGAAAGTAVFPVVGTAVGALVGLGLGALGNWAANHDYGETGFRQVMSACSAKGASKLVPKLSNADVRQIAYSIEDAKDPFNDDESAIVSALTKIPTIADLCAVDKKIPGGLVEFLDGLTDSPGEWKMFTRPLADMIEDSEIILTDEEQKKVSGTTKTTTTKYKSCSGTYTQGCYSEVIKQVQSCLGGLVIDGKFGPKTNEKLKSVGFSSGFSDNDVDKICDKTDIDTDVSGEEIVINQNEI
jgi:hypothetical protein